MKLEPAGSYEKVDQSALGGSSAIAWASRESEDPCWDRFLEETPLGQFQQSAMWARSKESEGWKPVRVLVTVEGEILAGFQILWRSSWGLRMGYLSKGPVVVPGHPGLADLTTALLRKTVRGEGLWALVAQPPDACLQMSGTLAVNGFMPNMLGRVNDATWIVDLRGGFEAVERRMGRTTRRNVRQAVSRGLKIREGGRQDVESFFELMLSTCRRQGIEPNPPDARHLLSLWDAAHPAGSIRLFFFEQEGKLLAGQLWIAFGKTLTGWKKGWAATGGERNPNDLSLYEGLKWAAENDFEFCDFSAFDRQMALRILAGEPLSPQQEGSRHMFHVRFGGSPRLLPEARVYFPNPLIRSAYRVVFRKRLQQAERELKLGQGMASDRSRQKLAIDPRQ